ncbi:hypothetical protein GJ496_004462, partial [Pomphorhynchus laevis]
KESIKQASVPGKICILDLDLNGVLSLQNSDMNPVCVFIMPPSLNKLEERLCSRSTETPGAISSRIQEARNYLEYFESNYDIYDCVITNDTVEFAANQLAEFLIKTYPDVLTA